MSTVHPGIDAWYREHLDEITAVARELWACPEVASQEFTTCALASAYMEKNGFAVDVFNDFDSLGQPNGFVATWGDGAPVLGLLGDMDAYPSVGNEAVPRKAPLPGAGHACGHNLSTTAGMAAAIALKTVMEREGLRGTVKFFGCPAEESLGGKLSMVRDGRFDGLDAVIQWHASSRQLVFGEVAIVSVYRFDVTFTGDDRKATGIYGARAAQNAAEMMSAGLSYMRKEFPVEMFNLKNDYLPKEDQWRDRFTVRMEVRYTDYALVTRCVERILNIARGAALMTDTVMSWQALVVYRDLFANHALNRAAYEAALKVPRPGYDAADKALAREIFRAYNGCEPTKEDLLSRPGMAAEWYQEEADGTPNLLTEIPQEPKGKQWIPGGGTDLAEVAYRAPCLFISGGGSVMGVPGHLWPVTVSSGTSIGLKGMRYGSEIMAQTAYDLLTRPGVLDGVRDEFRKTVAAKGAYTTNLPLPGGRFDPNTLG